MDWEVYIIRTQDGRLYTGISTDVERRLKEHETGRKGARFFRLSQPAEIVFREQHPNRSSATRREREIKKMTRYDKLKLIG